MRIPPITPSAALLCIAAGCTCGTHEQTLEPASSPEERPTSAPSRGQAAPPHVDPASAAHTAPERPPPEQTRAFLARLREARRLANEGQHTAAYDLFAALVRERPSERRLRCEAGYVASRAGRADDAEREIAAALGAWPRSPMRRDREALGMCLYNRGLVAEARGDRATAASAWRRSLELRSNAIVARRLAALGIAAQEEDVEAEAEDETVESVIAEMQQTFGATSEHTELERFASPTQGRVAVMVHLELVADDGHVDRHHALLLEDGSGVRQLDPELDEEIWHSWYDDHAIIGDPSFSAGPPALGELVAIQTICHGRGDAEDGAGDESYREIELYLCAERRDWACAQVALVSTQERDCASAGCDGDEEDDERGPLPELYHRGFALVWRLERDVLVLERDESLEVTEWISPPRQGRIPLGQLFDED